MLLNISPSFTYTFHDEDNSTDEWKATTPCPILDNAEAVKLLSF